MPMQATDTLKEALREVIREELRTARSLRLNALHILGINGTSVLAHPLPKQRR